MTDMVVKPTARLLGIGWSLFAVSFPMFFLASVSGAHERDAAAAVFGWGGRLTLVAGVVLLVCAAVRRAGNRDRRH